MKLVIYRKNGKISSIQRIPAEKENDDYVKIVKDFNAGNAHLNLTSIVVTVKDGSVLDFLVPTEKHRRDKSDFTAAISRDIEALKTTLDDLEEIIDCGFEG